MMNDKYKDFKIKREDTPVIALTKKEFEALYRMKLAGNKKLDQVRDVFCFSCVTGLRYSDLRQLSWVHINKDEIFQLRRKVFVILLSKTFPELY